MNFQNCVFVFVRKAKSYCSFFNENFNKNKKSRILNFKHNKNIKSNLFFKFKIMHNFNFKLYRLFKKMCFFCTIININYIVSYIYYYIVTSLFCVKNGGFYKND